MYIYLDFIEKWKTRRTKQRKERQGYGKRWAVEGVFSSVKRIFGESVRAHTQISAFQEVKRKFLIYNMLMNL